MRVIIISNRLPVTIKKKDNKLVSESSEGGLATGLSSVFKNTNNIWVGWPGIHLNNEKEEETVSEELMKENMIPVFLTEEEINEYYEGFSNETIWPAFHYFIQFTRYSQNHWKAYVKVNEKFCDIVSNILQPDDIVWIHDYQLLLLPQMIRRKFPEISIGYFQHIPFPSFEVFRMLPWRKELLKGMIGADLIGFQTYDDVRHFLSSTSRILGINNSGEQLDILERPVLVDLFPIGIDYEKYAKMARSKEVINNEKKSVLHLAIKS